MLTTEGFGKESLSRPFLGPTHSSVSLYGCWNYLYSDNRYATLLSFANEKVQVLKAMTSDPTPIPKSKSLVKTKFQKHQVQYWHFAGKKMILFSACPVVSSFSVYIIIYKRVLYLL
uniref:Uncharacterized protein n=1 Tax=Sphaerodactylus townsendi TaxID=933632 RepID=A0ACB8FX08_9SAUR